MSNLIPFPAFVGIEILDGTVQSATITDAHGIRPILADVGRHFFFVDVIEACGGRISMWHGASHEDAVREANILALDFGGSVRDRSEASA